MKGLFECLTDDLRFEIARQYKESVGNLDDLSKEDAMGAMMVLIAVIPKGVETIHKLEEELKQKKEQAVEEKPKKRSRGRKRKVKSDVEIDQIAGDLLSGVNI